MDASMRAPWIAVLRLVLMATGVATALVLCSLVFGAHQASAATGLPTHQRG